MLRFLYRCVLDMHPPHFRERFADEMLLIFDEAEGSLAALKLLCDAVISLFRQWAFRPEFWQEPAPRVAREGVPIFFTFQHCRLRTEALLYGVLLSAFALNGVTWTMGYAWNHPIFMDIRPGYGPGGKVPESKLISPPSSAPKVVPETSLYTDQGRVVLIFWAPARPSAAPFVPQARLETEAPAAPSSPNPSTTSSSSTQTAPVVDVPVSLLQSYVGTYSGAFATASRIVITAEKGRLNVAAFGEAGHTFVPISQSIFVARDVPNYVVEFASVGDARVDRVEIYRSGRHFTAFRR